MTGRLAVALLAALALFAFQLAHAQSSSAATGVPCPQTGNELVATDHAAYVPGSLVHVTGMGYAPGCDVVVKVTRPDGSIVSGDGTFTPGSDTGTTDFLGGLSYDYQLPSNPAIEGTYSVDVLGLADAVLAHTTFLDAPKVTGDVSPAWVPTSTPTDFSVLVRDDLAANSSGNFSCLKITVPTGYTSISIPNPNQGGANPTFSSGTGTWTTSRSGNVITMTTNGSMPPGGWARIDVQATSPRSEERR